MKRFNKIALLALTAVAFASCAEDNEWTQGVDVTDANEKFSNVSFETSSLNVEVVPEDPTTTTIRVVREKTDYAEEVPIDVLVNTDDMFQLGKCVFAEGEDVAEVVLDFSKAQVGKTYSMKIALTDPEHVSEYAKANTMVISVLRAKWEPIEGEGNFTIPVIGAKNPAIKIERRSDDHSWYRIVDPFAPMLLETEDGFERNDQLEGYTKADPYFKFRVMMSGDELNDLKVNKDGLVYFQEAYIGRMDDFFYGHRNEMSLAHPSEFQSLNNVESWQKNYVMTWQENGLPGKIQLAPMFYLEGLGGLNYTQDNGVFYLYFPGYKDPETADITSEDFEWEEALAATFVSGQMGTEGEGVLYKGTCVKTTDDANKEFEKEWGTAYLLESPYAEGYHIYFTVDKDGYIMVPDKVAKQPIGLQALGEDIYAKINASNSTFSAKQVVLNITFTNKDGSKVYGTSNEILQDITYTTVGTADWTYIFFANDDGTPYLDAGLELQQRDDDPSEYRILHALADVNIKFIINEDNTVSIPQQNTGGVEQTGLPIYVRDAKSAFPSYPASTYDPKTSLITAILYYNVGSADGWRPVSEPIQLHIGVMPEQPEEAAKAVRAKKVNASKPSKMNVRSPWASYKKVNTKKALEPMVLR